MNGNGFTQKYGTIIQTVVLLSIFVAGFSSWVITPIQHAVAQFQKDTLSLREYGEFKTGLMRQIERLQVGVDHCIPQQELDARIHAMDKRLDALHDTLAQLQAGMIPRTEHEQHWVTQEAKNHELSDRIVELRRDFGNTYSIGDQLKTLQKQIDDLRNTGALHNNGTPR